MKFMKRKGKYLSNKTTTQNIFCNKIERRILIAKEKNQNYISSMRFNDSRDDVSIQLLNFPFR